MLALQHPSGEAAGGCIFIEIDDDIECLRLLEFTHSSYFFEASVRYRHQRINFNKNPILPDFLCAGILRDKLCAMGYSSS